MTVKKHQATIKDFNAQLRKSTPELWKAVNMLIDNRAWESSTDESWSYAKTIIKKIKGAKHES